MTTLDREIASARPSLKKVAPLTYFLCWGYVVVNSLLGLSMFFLYLNNPTVPIAVADIINYQAWGALFVLLAILAAHSLLTNNWNMTRRMQILGLLIKAVWGVALIIRSFSAPQTLLITSVWLFFAYVQAMIYIYFIPTTGNKENDR